jgi:DNA-binding winged helix-turn-helix (wHTH) protein/TolB-like protein
MTNAPVTRSGRSEDRPLRFDFDDFAVDSEAGELRRAGERLRIQDLPFRLLVALLERPGEVVSRADLGRRLWPDGTFVDFEAGLNTAIQKLRDALGDHAEAPQYIETVPKRGYRFIGRLNAPVTTAGAAQSSPRRSVSGSTLIGAGLLALIAIATAVWWSRAAPVVRVAVVTFDNETGRADLDRLAQTLTDSTVLALGNDRRLAVIGNAAVLRTTRPFRDLVTIREALAADLIVVGQVQAKEDGLRVMAHLIRAADQAHVWVHATPLVAGGESAAEAEVVRGITEAVAAARSRGE